MKNKSLYIDKFEVDTIYKELFPKEVAPDKINLKEKTIITFSGITSSGKTTVSKEIEKKYGGIRISGDEIMNAVSKNELVKTIEENEKMKGKFIYTFLKESKFKNKLIILDISIDRTYNTFFEECKKSNWNYYIIQLELSKQEAIKRFKKRNPDNLDNWLPRLSSWLKDHEEFKKNIKPNITLEGTSPNLEKLFKKLNKTI